MQAWLAIAAMAALALTASRARGAVTYDFGSIGITADQTVRVNVVNTRLAPNGPPQRVLVGFVDAGGNAVLNADGFPLVLDTMLAPGQSAFLDLPGSPVVGADPRAQLRAVVQPDGPPTRILSTLEVIDNATARTALILQPQGPPSR